MKLESSFLQKETFSLEKVLKSEAPFLRDEERAFFDFAFQMAAEGHLCLRWDRGKLEPDPKAWVYSLDYLEEEEKEKISALLLKGFDSVRQLDNKVPFFVFRENKLYLERNLKLEQDLIRALENKKSQKVPLNVSLSKIVKGCKDLQEKSLLGEKQALAIEHAASHALTFLTGGPGTGKTYTLGRFLELFWHSLDSKQKESFTVGLAAPTGKASAHLLASFQKLSLPSELLEKCYSYTLHRLLGIMQSGALPSFHSKRPLGFSLLIVDECSMIDARMFSYLLQACPDWARLILVGDPHQLPPVETGCIFEDLLLREKQHAVSLTECLRAENPAIIDFSQAVLKEKKLSSAEGISLKSWQKFSPEKGVLMQKMFQFLTPLYEANSEKEFLQNLLMRKILTPLREGEWGVEELNQALFHLLLKSKGGRRFFCPILITKNDAERDLFNGDIGVLVLNNPKKKPFLRDFENQAFFLDEEGELREFPACLLPSFEPAFVQTVHKSQGSEFEHVLLLLPKGSAKFGKEVLYTAATRAKKSLTIFEEEGQLQEAGKASSKKVTGI